jgi:hypothetical protein
MSTPTFKYESSRRLYALRKASYDDATFTSADAARCSDVLYAINKKSERPKEQRSKDLKEDAALLREWNRVTEIASSNAFANVQPVD